MALMVSALTGVRVTIMNCSVPLQLGVDESYSLEIDINGGYAYMACTILSCFGFHYIFSHIHVNFQRRQSQCNDRIWSLPCPSDFESAHHF
jgi:hypothetical protein